MGKNKDTSNSGENSSSTNFPNVSILLKDGTQLDVILNGSTYESEDIISEDKLTDENLETVQIDGETHRNMTLISLYPWNGGTRFAIRDMTTEEMSLKEIAQNTANIDYLSAMTGIDL